MEVADGSNTFARDKFDAVDQGAGMCHSRNTIRHERMPYIQAKTTPHLDFSSRRWTDPLPLENRRVLHNSARQLPLPWQKEQIRRQWDEPGPARV